MEISSKICIIGAGPAGCYLSMLLARRGFHVDVLEKRPDLRESLKGEGRSMNLQLSHRGLAALERLGLEHLKETGVQIWNCNIYEREGRIIHDPMKDIIEIEYSVNRNKFNIGILDEAIKEPNVTFKFDCNVFDIWPTRTQVKYFDKDGNTHTV